MTEKLSPFTFVNGINKKDYCFTDETNSAYDKYLITKAFSYFQDTIEVANAANMYPQMGDKQHFDLFYHGISKGNRYTKWPKRIVKYEDLNVKEVAEFLELSIQKTEEALELMTDVQIEDLKNMLSNKGGIANGSR